MGLAMSYLRLSAPVAGETQPARIAQVVFGDREWRRFQPAERVLDVGAAWQALHYLITGDPWDGRVPEADVVCGGPLLSDDLATRIGLDVIYLTPQRVKPAADHLAVTPFEAIADRFDLPAMTAAGVQDADRMDPGVRDRVLRPAYAALTRFYGAAATEGQGIYKAMKS